jgi:thiol-disulfide isomerase/thioredoxin
MKHLSLLTLFILVAFSAFSQADSISAPPFQRYPTVPPVKLLLTDSLTYFTKEDVSKKMEVLVMLFSPDCEHCQHETEQIIKHIDEFKDVQIIMATTLPFDKMKDFYKKYELNRFSNIIVGRDGAFMLPVFYNVRNLPFLGLYNRKKDLITVFEGSIPVERILEELKK